MSVSALVTCAHLHVCLPSCQPPSSLSAKKAATSGHHQSTAVSCRRSKAALLETDVPKLEKLIRKGKNVTKTVIDDRMAKVPLEMVIVKIQDSPECVVKTLFQHMLWLQVKQIRDGIADIPDGAFGVAAAHVAGHKLSQFTFGHAAGRHRQDSSWCHRDNTAFRTGCKGHEQSKLLQALC